MYYLGELKDQLNTKKYTNKEEYIVLNKILQNGLEELNKNLNTEKNTEEKTLVMKLMEITEEHLKHFNHDDESLKYCNHETAK